MTSEVKIIRKCFAAWRYNHHGRGVMLALGLILIVAVLVAGCGVKSPPMVPAKSLPLPPSKVRVTLTDLNKILLEWSLPEGRFAPSAGLVVKQARVSLKGDVCRDCPLRFEPLAELPWGTRQYKVDAAPGYRYFFKLHSVTGQNLAGSDSETVRLDVH